MNDEVQIDMPDREDPVLDPDDHLPKTTISVSAGLGKLLKQLGVSLAFASYQSGHLFLVGLEPTGKISIDQQRFERSMGLSWANGRLHLATATQIIRFENMLQPGEVADGRNDIVLVPRLSWTTNDVDAHELAIEKSGRPIFVATRFNCVATVDDQFSFSPVWMPPFLNGSDKGDRCHLNGLALKDGELAYATLVGSSEEVDGWRDHRRSGGLVVDCKTGEEVVKGLSMPHSPRWHAGALWLLDSGTGSLARFDLTSGERRDVAFCPGFARGLSLGKRYAAVSVSKPRDERFEGLLLQEELARRNLEAWCAVLIIDLEDGSVRGWIRLEGPIQELFDVTVLPGIRCPRSLGPGTKELHVNVRPRPISS